MEMMRGLRKTSESGHKKVSADSTRGDARAKRLLVADGGAHLAQSRRNHESIISSDRSTGAL
jgi:hypothetical protein